MIGDVLDGWKLVKKLGEGGTGETYLAERQETGEKAAVKILFLHMSSDRALLDRLFADAASASKVNHVSMTDLLGWGVREGGRAFLVMELLEGKTLTDALIELGSVTDLASFADIGWQLATLLGAAHAAGLVHGALKPDGIYLTFPPSQAPRPLVKVLDFGMARFSLNVRHSQTGSLLGAPLYMSPEVGRGLGKVDHRADIYSLGCILFEMLCGRPPFVREGKGELIIAHMTEPPPPVSSLEPAVPQAIDLLVGRMLTKNPAVRPQGMGEVAGVLEKFFKCPAPGAGQAPAAVPAKPAPSVPAPGFSAPPPAPAAAPVPELVPAALRPVPRPAAPPRPEATAFLPPGSEEVASPQGTSAAPQAWLARVRQRTAILVPSSPPDRPPSAAVSVLLPAPEDQPRRSRAGGARTREAPRPAQAPARAAPINLPVVIATASIVLAVGAGILVFRGRTAAPEPAAPAPREQVKRPSPSEDGFRPPPPPPQPSPAAAPEPAADAPRPKAASVGTGGQRAPRPRPEPAGRPKDPKKKTSRW